MTFADLPIGARFKFFGRVYTKVAPAMAEDENMQGHIFGADGQQVAEPLPEQPKAESYEKREFEVERSRLSRFPVRALVAEMKAAVLLAAVRQEIIRDRVEANFRRLRSFKKTLIALELFSLAVLVFAGLGFGFIVLWLISEL